MSLYDRVFCEDEDQPDRYRQPFQFWRPWVHNEVRKLKPGERVTHRDVAKRITANLGPSFRGKGPHPVHVMHTLSDLRGQRKLHYDSKTGAFHRPHPDAKLQER